MADFSLLVARSLSWYYFVEQWVREPRSEESTPTP